METTLTDPRLSAVGSLRRRGAALLGAGWLPWAILVFGVGLRLIQYLSNRSLWVDEAMLVRNILDRSYGELLQPLSDNQGAPIGFLVATKALTQAFGDGEFVLRLLPLVGGIASLILFHVLLKRYIPTPVRLIPLFLFAINLPLIYYSSEAKQYATDLTITLILVLAALWIHDHPLTIGRALLFGGLGALAMWCSHPASFTLAGIGLVMGISALARRDRARVRGLALVGALWGASFVVLYTLSLRHLETSDYLQTYFRANFMPSPLNSEGWQWLLRNFRLMFDNPQGLQINDVAALLFVVGAVTLYRRRPTEPGLFVAPILVTLGASWLGKYPFGGRLFLFALPLLLVLVGEGLRAVVERTRQTLPVLSVALIGFLLLNPLVEATTRVTFYPQEIKPVLEYISQHRLGGDRVYVYYFAQFAYDYYAPRYSLSNANTLVGRTWVDNIWLDPSVEPHTNFSAELDRLRGSTYVWVIFTNANSDEQRYTRYLDGIGRQVDSVRAPGASGYLYNLGG